MPDAPSATADPPGTADATATKPKRSAADLAEFLATARKRFDLCVDAEATDRTKQLDDQKFIASDQWDDEIRAARQKDKRPCLTVSRIPQGVKQITNEQRKNPPAVQVNPVDDAADLDTAEILQGIIRNIETQSDADIAYETAGDSQAGLGLGYLTARTEYVDDTTNQQRIVIDRILNRFSVYVDPGAVKFDKADMRFAFIPVDLPREVYEARYPDSDLSGVDDFTSFGDDLHEWISDETIRVCQYWYLETKRVRIGGEGWSRIVERKTVHWCKFNAVEILEETTLPSHPLRARIPIIPVVGDELVDEQGHVTYRGIVRDAKGAQIILNVEESAIVEQIGLGARSPWLVDSKQIEGFESMWAQANNRSYATLNYNRWFDRGDGVYVDGGTPVRNVQEPPIQAAVVAAERAGNNLRAAMGWVDVHGGETQREQSGRAILARQHQSETGNFNYLDNLGRAVRSLGRMLLDWIPVVYDVPQIVRILGKDGEPKKVMVHAGNPPPEIAPGPNGEPPPMDPSAFNLQRGLKGVYDLSAGQYDVTISVGPSYQTTRQENFQTMAQVVKENPNVFPLIGDLFFKFMDDPIARQISDRMRKMLPEPLQEHDDPAGQANAVQGKLQQATQQLQAMGQQLQQLQQEHQGKILEIQSKEKIAQMQAQINQQIEAGKAQLAIRLKEMDNARAIAVARIGAAKEVLNQQAEAAEERLATGLEQAHDHAQAKLQHAHEAGLLAQEQAHAVQQSVIGHQQALAAGDQAHQQQLETAEHAAQLAPEPTETGESGV